MFAPFDVYCPPRRHRARFHTVVPCPGDFHGNGHMCFAINEGWHDAKYGQSKNELGFEKVPKHIKDFENNSYKHVTNFLRADLIGTLSYLLLDVTKPKPELLLDDHRAYEQELQSAGGITAFQSIKYGGVPMAHSQLAGRSADGAKQVELTPRSEITRKWVG